MSDKWLKSGVGVEGDLRKISDNYRLPYYSGSFELKTLAEVGKIRKPNLVNLYSLFVGQQHFKDKSQSICDWSLPLVEKKKIEYAARDAIMSYQVFKYMMTPSLNLIKSKTDTILDLDLDKTLITCFMYGFKIVMPMYLVVFAIGVLLEALFGVVRKHEINKFIFSRDGIYSMCVFRFFSDFNKINTFYNCKCFVIYKSYDNCLSANSNSLF